MAKRELNNKKYNGLAGLICKKIEKIAEASVEEIMEIKGFSKKQAQAVYDYFRRTSDEV